MKNLNELKIGSKNKMLFFKDSKHFKQAFEIVSKLDEVAEIEESQLELFESNNNFKCLRKVMIGKEDNDIEQNNDKISPIVPDPILQTLLSTDNKVQIGKEIYDFSIDKMVKSNKANKSNSCKIYLFGSGTKYYSSNNSKRVKLNGYIIYVPFLMSIMGASVKSQKQKNNGNWKKYRTKLQVAIVGDERNKRCDRPTTIGKFKGPKKRKTLSVSLIKWGGNGMWFKPMEASAKCVYGSNGTYGVFLT